MRNKIFTKLVACLGLMLACSVSAGNATLMSLTPVDTNGIFTGSTYANKVPTFNQTLQGASSRAQQVETVRQWIRSGRHSGASRLTRQFRNFAPGSRINIADPQVIKTIKLLASDNPNVVKGAARELVYYQKFYNSPLFSEVTMRRPVPTESGVPSDQDISFRSTLSGKRTWVEVKTTKAPLRLDNRIREQLKRMSKFKGRRVLVSRGKVSAAVKMQARQFGIEVHENVKSSDVTSTIARPDLSELRIRGHMAKSTGVLLVTVGAWRLYNNLSTPGKMDGVRWRATASDSTLIASGGIQFTGGVLNAKLASEATRTLESGGAILSKGSQNLGRLQKAGKWCGRAGWALLAVYEGIEVYRYIEGDMNPRQFAASQGGLGGALGGAVSGALIMAWWDGPLPFGEMAGGLVGGTIGYFAGKETASLVYNEFVFSTEEHENKRVEVLEQSIQRNLSAYDNPND